MSVFSDQKKNTLRQVSADAFALTQKRLKEDLPTELAEVREGGVNASSEAEVKEEAEQRAETHRVNEEGAKPKKGAKR